MKGICIEINYKVESLNSFKTYTLNSPTIYFYSYTYIIIIILIICNTAK